MEIPIKQFLGQWFPNFDLTQVDDLLSIPEKHPGIVDDLTIEEQTKKIQERAKNVILAFSDVLIPSLERRATVCKENLMNHINNIEFNDGLHIGYCRNDGSKHVFNVESYIIMFETIKSLKNNDPQMILDNRGAADQAIKALLNDPVQDHSDKGEFKYSDLVSLLCEVHLYVTR